MSRWQIVLGFFLEGNYWWGQFNDRRILVGTRHLRPCQIYTPLTHVQVSLFVQPHGFHRLREWAVT